MRLTGPLQRPVGSGGYVLGLGFYRSAQASRGVGLARYFMRRFRRLEPPFVLIMTFFFLILLASGRFGLIDGFGHYLASILYLHGIIYWEPSTINTVTWSLEVELQFYVLAPLLYAAYRLPKGTTMALMSLLAFAFVVTAYAMGDFYLTLLSHGHFFVLGAVFPILGTFRIPKMLAFVFPLALAAYFLIDANYASITGNLAKIGLLTVVFACTLGCEPVRRFLSTPALFIIGGACYSIYLIHYPLLSAFSKLWSLLAMPGGFALYLGGGLVTVLMVSIAFFAIAERPFMTPRDRQHSC